MTVAEALETTRIHNVAGRTGDRTALLTTRPCRAPHHTISDAGLIGGGHVPMPGDVSLAHHGVLFLDELPEFCRHVLGVLRYLLGKNVTFRQFLDVPDLTALAALAMLGRSTSPMSVCISISRNLWGTVSSVKRSIFICCSLSVQLPFYAPWKI